MAPQLLGLFRIIVKVMTIDPRSAMCSGQIDLSSDPVKVAEKWLGADA
jgi:hypothetical protein